MRIPERGMRFTRITYHADVTQCLGGLQQRPWYIVVSKPSGSVDKYPQESDLVAFRIPPGVSIKMNMGTWHAGKAGWWMAADIASPRWRSSYPTCGWVGW
jgi:ureidoglycolate hydrolase